MRNAVPIAGARRGRDRCTRQTTPWPPGTHAKYTRSPPHTIVGPVTLTDNRDNGERSHRKQEVRGFRERMEGQLSSVDALDVQQNHSQTHTREKQPPAIACRKLAAVAATYPATLSRVSHQRKLNNQSGMRLSSLGRTSSDLFKGQSVIRHAPRQSHNIATATMG